MGTAPRPAHLLEQIDHWGRINPEAIAHRSGGRNLTYGELLHGSDAVAAHLSATFGADRAPIAVQGEKEPEMLIAFLGAVKSGRAYVPLGHARPAQLIQRILEMSRTSTTLTPESVAEIVRRSAGAALPERASLAPNDPFYIIFTSGSTGEPKGVVITLANLEFFLGWMHGEQRFATGAEVFLNQAPFAFDLSVMDLYCSLTSGSTLYSITRADIQNRRVLLERLRESETTVWVSTPSFAQVCLAEHDFNETMMPRLERFLFCGEILAGHVAAELLRRFPRAVVWNTYGPTEATVATTSVRLDEALVGRGGPMPIGYPAPGTQVVICDEEGALLPEGERGEVVIAGPNVSPGYLEMPAGKRPAFVQFQGLPAYRTGDHGWSEDGLLFFAGRSDSQIKLRGYRIELGDLEANLRALADVRDAAVIPIGEPGHIQFLVAFIILESHIQEHPDLGARLKHLLGERLPRYMLPKHFRFVDSFPLTPNAKADRDALGALWPAAAGH